MKAGVLSLFVLVVAGCSTGIDAAKSAAREAVFPPRLVSRQAADAYVATSFSGGRVDEVAVRGLRYLVLFRHGSGRPVIGIAVYRRGLFGWGLLSEPQTRTEESMHAVAAEDRIYAISEPSGTKSLLYDPAAKKG